MLFILFAKRRATVAKKSYLLKHRIGTTTTSMKSWESLGYATRRS